MSFVQWPLPWVLLAVACLHRVVPSGLQNVLLIAASLLVYGWIHPWFVAVLLISAHVDFVAAWLIHRAPRLRRAWLAWAIGANLGMLATFKYLDFGVAQLQAALASLGVDASLHALGWAVPLGLSFYTFQTLSYTVDVYRGTTAARTGWAGWRDVLAYVAFFPQLVAGPIERAGHLLPQLEAERRPGGDDVAAGVSLLCWGAVQKVVIADSLAPYVDRAFRLEAVGGPVVAAATLGFMVQVYADLSGYTDLARGAARLLGIELVRNFDRPWRAATTGEFWSRWHMSMTHWVRDYVLTPLLGSPPVSTARWATAIVITLLAIGVWHGAGWNFIIFGAFHAVATLASAAIERRAGPARTWHPWARRTSALIHLVAVGWTGALIFREPDVGRLTAHLSRPPWAGSPEEAVVAAGILGVVLAGIATLAAGRAVRRWLRAHRSPRWWWLHSTAWLLASVAVWLFAGTSRVDFLYFAF